MITPLLLLLVGLLVSAFGTVVGFGGGIFIVPVLIIFFRYPVELAIGSSMAAIVPAALLASFFNYREKNIDYLVASLLQFPAMGGTVLGAFLVTFLPVLELQFTLAFFVIIVGFYLIGTPKLPPPDQRHTGMMYRLHHLPTSFIRRNRQKHLAYRLNGSLVVLFGLLTGTIAGLFGIGGGFLQTPIMIKIFRMPARIATSTSLFILLATSLAGLSTHYWLGHVVWEKAVPLMIGFALGAALGQLAKRVEYLPRLDYLVGIALFLVGITLIINSIIKSKVLFSIPF